MTVNGLRIVDEGAESRRDADDDMIIDEGHINPQTFT
jgi:hypothetical protein